MPRGTLRTLVLLLAIPFVVAIGLDSCLHQARADATSSRIGSSDWICYDSDGKTVISNNARLDTALVSCLNASAKAAGKDTFVQSARYKINYVQPAPPVTQPPTTTPPPASGGTGSATLGWQPPVENTDGSPLTNLVGYVVHYGSAPGSLTQTINIASAGITTYVVQGLPTGTTYFAVSAVNDAGVESSLSNVVSKTL